MTLISTVRKGFTLIELLVVIVIIAILIALLVPAVQAAREAARRMQCSNNIKQISLAFHNYESTYRRLPRSYFESTQLGWTVSILPFTEQSSLYDQVNFNAGSFLDIGKNQNHGLRRISFLICPSSPVENMATGSNDHVNPSELIPPNTGQSPYTTHYYGINGPRGTSPDGTPYQLQSNQSHEGVGMSARGMMLAIQNLRMAQVTDGLSNTLQLGEMSWVNPKTGSRFRSWMRGGQGLAFASSSRNIVGAINSGLRVNALTPFNDMPMGSMHSGGTQFGMGDGSVQFLSQSIDLSIYRGLATRDGGEIYSNAF